MLVLGGDAGAGRAQHGAAREGRARLPAGAAHRRPRREGAAAHPRDRLPEAAQGREEAGAAGGGGARRARGGRGARRARRSARRTRTARSGRPQASPRRQPAATPRRPARLRRPAPPAPSSPATPSAATRTSPTSTGGSTPWSSSPSAPSAATSWTRYLAYFDDELPPQQGAHRRGHGAHPRRRAAQPRLQLPVPAGHREGRGRPPLGRGRQRVHRLPAGRRARRCWAATTSRSGEQVAEVRRGVRPGHRAVPRVRAQAGRAGQPAHAVRRDVPHARLGHGERDGGHPGGARLHRQEVGDQGRRRVPRLERPDGVRPARARHLAVRGQGHPVRRDGARRASSSPTTWTRCAGSSSRTGCWAARRR